MAMGQQLSPIQAVAGKGAQLGASSTQESTPPAAAGRSASALEGGRAAVLGADPVGPGM